jgi:acetylornithine deacetylase/succinyl-diaminopimelate desuccinylase-like protein
MTFTSSTRQAMVEQDQRLSETIDELWSNEVALLQLLVRAKSANHYTADTSPSDVPVEAEVAAILYEHMRQLEWHPALYGVSKIRQNVLCTLPGTLPTGKTLILTTHMDTVPASQAYTRDPWSAAIEQGRLYGVGAADAKAQIAAFLYAVQAVQQIGIELAGTLTVAFVVDEETGANSPYGTRYLLEQGLLHGDAALIGEPGEDKIAIGHRGVYRFRLRTHGESVHTGLKEWELQTRGHNAAVDMAQIIQALSHCTLPGRPSPAFPGRRNVLTFPTLIHGGSSVNMVPESCEAYGDVRLLPGIEAHEVRRIIEQCLAPLGISYELEEVVFVAAAETSPSASIVQTLAQVVETVTGVPPRLEGAGPACDGWMFSARGIETICGYGAVCGGVHGADEWVDLASLRRVTEIYARTIIEYLN